MNTTKERFLYHEAGHAVMALGADLPFVALMQAGDGSTAAGMLHMGSVSAAQLRNEKFKRGYILATLAGAMAEDIKYGGGGIESLCTGLGSVDSRQLLNSQLVKESLHFVIFSLTARTFLAENWQAVEALVKRLRAQPLMLHSDVRATVGDIPLIPVL